MRQKLLFAIVLPLAMTTFAACQTKQAERPAAGGGGGNGDDTEEVTYEGWVKGFVATNCGACHSPDSEDGGPDFSTYLKLKTATKKGKVMKRLTSDDPKEKMPPKKTLKEAQIEKFQAWIDQKYPEGEKKGSGGSKTAKVTYLGWVKKYEAASCGSGTAGCHGSGNATGIDLSSYESSAEAAKSSLASIKGGRMPKGNADKDAAVIAKYEAWVKAGTPEDDEASGTDTDTGSDTDTDTGTGTGGNEEAKEAGFELLKSANGCGGASCHSQGGVPPDLSTDAKLEAAKDSVLRTTKGGSMPKGNPYDSANKAVVQDWFDAL